jgi:hypothetical protein
MGAEPGDLVLAEDLREVEMAEFAGLGWQEGRASGVSSMPDSFNARRYRYTWSR